MGHFPSRPILGSIRGEGTPPTNPSRHLRKERSFLPLEWLLTEDRGRSPTAVAPAAARIRAAAAVAATAATPCPDHEDVAVAATAAPHRRSPSRRCHPQAIDAAAISAIGRRAFLTPLNPPSPSPSPPPRSISPDQILLRRTPLLPRSFPTALAPASSKPSATSPPLPRFRILSASRPRNSLPVTRISRP